VVANTALALLGSLLRGWSHGRYSLTEVRRRLDRAVELLLRAT
jgi:hypothetical protein